jgi:manganese-dependent inorganic pyrophosphatase
VTMDALLGDARDQLRRTNLAALAVIDDERVLRGLVLRRHLAEQSRRRVILTDHNHPDQAAPGVAESQIIAIVDHHNLGGLQTLQPLSMRCDPVGCCCTLIAEEYRQSNAPLEPALAGLMLGAILSDTVRFRSPTTTPRDRDAAEWLAECSGEGIDELARQLFRARLPDPIPPPDWWVSRDMKVFEFGPTRLSISQMELASVRDVMPPASALRDALQRLAASQQTDTALLLLTDILEGGSVLVAADAEGEAIATRAFGGSFAADLLLLPGVMSRKKQVVPAVAAALTS